VDARRHDSVNQLGKLSDAELIAKDPGIPNVSHQMELDRRLKVAITDLTTETIDARKASDRTARRLMWLTIVLVILTAVLVALTSSSSRHSRAKTSTTSPSPLCPSPTTSSGRTFRRTCSLPPTATTSHGATKHRPG